MAVAGTASKHTATEQIQGTLLVVGASLVFAVIGLIVQVDPLPLLATTQARFTVCWMVAACLMLRYRFSGKLHWFGPEHLRKLLLLKATMSYSFVALWWMALRRAPLGNCVAIVYSGPMFTSIWSKLLLGEHLGSIFGLQCILVTLGAILIVDPPFLHKDAGIAEHGDYKFAFAALAVGSLVPVVTRSTRECSWMEVEHTCAFMGALILNPFLLLSKYCLTGHLVTLPPTALSEVGMIVMAAFGIFLAVGMETKGYQLAEPGKAAMFRYVEIPFAYLLQLFATGTPIRATPLLGAFLIATSMTLGALKQRWDTAKEEAARTSASRALLLADAENSKGPEGLLCMPGPAAPPHDLR